MSATFNWAYRPGVSNIYNINIANSADDVKPNNAAYVALFGNDITGNGSRKYPWRTIDKARSVMFNGNGYIVIGSGTYREFLTANVNQINFVADGDVTFDFSYQPNWTNQSNGVNIAFYNIKFKGSGSNKIAEALYVDCTTDGAAPGINIGGMVNGSIRNIFRNSTLSINFTASITNGQNNNTFYNCNQIAVSNITNGFVRSCIFHRCNITVDNLAALANFQYCMFYQCNFKVSNGIGTPGAVYPSVPAGYIYYSDIAVLRTALIDARLLQV
ncbi:hypothetical protein [Mucilaginibacter panaciglaebae]|uniref:DUF1565 domain-containing protein n=1 Tax=Mucilaginibacter panaciglaebae TaxID=502331 RepID=A0ABP7WNP4_9SPHI